VAHFGKERKEAGKKESRKEVTAPIYAVGWLHISIFSCNSINPLAFLRVS
jgi:hypothetical protein